MLIPKFHESPLLFYEKGMHICYEAVYPDITNKILLAAGNSSKDLLITVGPIYRLILIRLMPWKNFGHTFVVRDIITDPYVIPESKFSFLQITTLSFVL